MNRRPHRFLAAAALVAGLTGACGVPADDEPRPIAQEESPGDDVTEGAAQGMTGDGTLYLTRADATGNHLAPVQMQVPVGSTSTAPTPTTALETLLDFQPDEALQGQGYLTQIPANTRLVDAPELDEHGVLTVDVSESLYRVQSPAASLAFGQIVCTADAFDEVGGVRFELDGEPRRVPMGDGESSGEPLTCASYENLLEDPAAP